MTQDTNTASGAADLRAEVAMIDAAMVEMTNITPPLKRSECARLLRAALAAGQATAAQPGAAYAALPDDEQIWAAREAWSKQANEHEAMRAALIAGRASHGQAPAQAAPAYKDSTPELHIGDSAFESWYSSYNPTHKGDKQRARDAYAAGMGDLLMMAAPAAVAGPKKWAPEEVEYGERGIRWVTNEGIHERPTDHDVRAYLKRTPTANGCLCDECKVFYAAAPQPSPVAQGDALESEYQRGYRQGYEQRDAEVRGALA